ncbi:MAG: hypothetical protein P8Y76_08885 [bacterium]
MAVVATTVTDQVFASLNLLLGRSSGLRRRDLECGESDQSQSDCDSRNRLDTHECLSFGSNDEHISRRVAAQRILDDGTHADDRSTHKNGGAGAKKEAYGADARLIDAPVTQDSSGRHALAIPRAQDLGK